MDNEVAERDSKYRQFREGIIVWNIVAVSILFLPKARQRQRLYYYFLVTFHGLQYECYRSI